MFSKQNLIFRLAFEKNLKNIFKKGIDIALFL